MGMETDRIRIKTLDGTAVLCQIRGCGKPALYLISDKAYRIAHRVLRGARSRSRRPLANDATTREGSCPAISAPIHSLSSPRRHDDAGSQLDQSGDFLIKLKRDLNHPALPRTTASSYLKAVGELQAFRRQLA